MTCAASKFAWLLLAGLVLPGCAAQSVTVDQMNQWLASTRRQHESDPELAQKIAGRQLSDRATLAQLAHWETELPGPQSHVALLALFDASQFLPLPQSQIVKIPPPSVPTRVAMLSKATNYVIRTVGKLPDFYATRQTLHFQEMTSLASNPWYRTTGTRVPPTALYLAGRWKGVVTYRDGAEVPFADAAASAPPPTAQGFTTTGEFGPILSVVLGDALHGKVEWAYWKLWFTSREAVFHYSVPQNQSHYSVQLRNFHPPIHLYPAYHGEITLEPSTGAILRVTIIADLKPPVQRFRAEMMVIYAPVTIGGKTYICPVKAVALSTIPLAKAHRDRKYAGPLQTQLNDVTFTHYHKFRTDMIILPSAESISGKSLKRLIRRCAPAAIHHIPAFTPADTAPAPD